MATLTHARRSQTEMASPNPHAQPFSPQPDGETIPKQLRSAAPTAVKRRQHLQSPTLRTPHRSQTAKPSPNSYAQPLPPRSNGDSISNPLHSEHLSVAKPRWQPQIPTLTAPQRRQMETAPPNSYGQPPSPQPNREAFPKRARPEGNKPSKPHNKQQKGLSCAITHRRGPQSSQIESQQRAALQLPHQLGSSQLSSSQINSAQAKFSSAGISSPCQRPEPEQLPAVPACWPQRLRW